MRAPASEKQAFSRRSGAIAACAWIALATGCGASVPHPREGAHAGDPPVPVAEPPPPPKIEMVPSAPEGMRDPVWVDGQWLWDGHRWEWQEGRWETQEEGATYAPPQLVYLSDRQLGWLAGKWHRRSKP